MNEDSSRYSLHLVDVACEAHCSVPALTSALHLLLQLAAANFWAELDDASSPYRPYLDALPSPGEMMCPLVMMPTEYHSLLANHKAVSRCSRPAA